MFPLSHIETFVVVPNNLVVGMNTLWKHMTCYDCSVTKYVRRMDIKTRWNSKGSAGRQVEALPRFEFRQI